MHFLTKIISTEEIIAKSTYFFLFHHEGAVENWNRWRGPISTLSAGSRLTCVSHG